MITSASVCSLPEFIAFCREIREGQKVEINLTELIENFIYAASLLGGADDP
jgi:hypothetical protein